MTVFTRFLVECDSGSAPSILSLTMHDVNSDQHTVNSIIALSSINNAGGNNEKNRLLTLRRKSELYRIGEITSTASTPPLLHNPSKSALDLC
jgi:hypothetical protein